MARAVADIERQIRELSDRDREELLRSLIKQLDGPSDQGVDRAWLIESHRRLEELEQGKSQTVPGSEVIEEARKLVTSIGDRTPK